MKMELGKKRDQNNLGSVAQTPGYEKDDGMHYPCVYIDGIEGLGKLKPGAKVTLEGTVSSKRTGEKEGDEPDDLSVEIKVTHLKTSGGNSKIDKYPEDSNKDEIEQGLDEATNSEDDSEEEEE